MDRDEGFVKDARPASLRGYDAKLVGQRLGLDTGSETLVQQSFKDECDINTIVRRFGVTREMPVGVVAGVYGDFSGICDLDSALDIVERAERGFQSLAPEVRDRFQNDPRRLMHAVQSVPFDEFLERYWPKAPVSDGVVAVDKNGQV